jgi:hypothetical protein
MPLYTTLKGVGRYGETTLSSHIEDGTVGFFNWALLEAGAFFNVSIPTSGIYGGDSHKLRLVDDPNYTAGQVWEGFRSNWIWESGVFSDDPPVNISGVHIGGAFYATRSTHPNYNASYAHYIDYANGRVVSPYLPTPFSSIKRHFLHLIIFLTLFVFLDRKSVV